MALRPVDTNIDRKVVTSLAKTKQTWHYAKLEKIGEGTYGVVYKARDLRTQALVALKKIKPEIMNDEGVPGTSIREIVALKDLSCHPNIVHLLDYAQRDNGLYMVFEFLDCDLGQYLRRTTVALSTKVIKSWMFQLLLAVCFCHSRRIIHRDLKPQNLLLTKNGVLKVADFGLCRHFTVPFRRYTHEVCTQWYRAPEILLGARVYSLGMDLWSAGCIFAEMVMREPLLPGDSEIDQLFKTFQLLGTPNEQVWPGVSELGDYKDSFPSWKPASLVDKMPALDSQGLDLLQQMLRYNPTDRISAMAAMKHPFFADLDQSSFHTSWMTE